MMEDGRLALCDCPVYLGGGGMAGGGGGCGGGGGRSPGR